MGALLAGTDDQFEQEKGSLYMLRKDKTVNKSLTKIGISNGLAWSSDKTKFYYIDSLKYRVDSYDYDDSTGALCKSLYMEFSTLNRLPFRTRLTCTVAHM